MHIRAMTHQDISFAVELATSEGWDSENEDVFRAFLFHDPQGCFIAEIDDAPVGICTATAYDNAGFFGELIVSPEYRNQGVGTRLLTTAVEYLEKKQIGSIYLDSVPEVVPLYERAGFRKVCASLRFQGEPEGKEDTRVRAMRKWDLDTVCSLDKIVFSADRQFFLKWISFIGPDFAKVLMHDDKIIGYISGRYTSSGISVGPWVAPPLIKNPEGLLLSLAMEVFHEPLNIGILEKNTRAVQLVESLGFKEKETAPVRMVLGKSEKLGTSPYCFAIGSPAKG